MCARQYSFSDAVNDERTLAWSRLCNRDPHNCGEDCDRFGDICFCINLCQLPGQPGSRCIVLSAKALADACWSITCVREDM